MYILRRLAAAVLLLLIVSAVTFAIFFLVPRLAGQTSADLASQYVGRDPSAAAIKAVEENLGFNQPLYQQYWTYIHGIFAGRNFQYGPDASHCNVPCFGYSFKSHLAVWPEITARLPITLSLAVGAAVLWVVSGVGIGVLSALRKGSLLDRLAMGIALTGISLPVFFTGLIALDLFSYHWPIFANDIYVPITQNPLMWAKNLVLPWVTLAFLYSALYARLTRAGMLETMNEDYIRTARAKGLPERTVVVKHGLRAALTPILTIFGMDLGLLLGGAILVENVFSMQGVGEYTVLAIQNQDLPEVMAVTLVAAFFIIIANLLVDIMYAAVDPRVRYL